MTNPTKLEELTKKIQELVPEIMELKFGCRVSVKGNLRTILGKGKRKDEHSNAFWLTMFCGKITVEYDIDQIYGRYIQLADVMRAINMTQNYWCFDTDGQLFYDQDWDPSSQWNLAKPLHLQSPETIDFLHSIFYGNL